jgi:hypothetical protein
MSAPSKIARIAVVMFSLTLVVGYVWHSHVTPNTPPPDPLGINGIDLELEPEVVEFEGFINHGSPVPAKQRSANELRIISSKVINQPVFSVRHGPFRWKQPAQKEQLKIRFGQFGVEINGKPGHGSDSPANTRIEVPYRRQPSFWQRLFGKKRVNFDQQAFPPGSKRNGSDLRIISSKVINQPIFSVRNQEPETPELRATTSDFQALGLQMVKDLEIVPGIVTTAPQPAGFLLKRPADSLQQPEAIKRILFDADAAASSEKMLTPEKLSEDYFRALEMRRPMMSGSKSGMVRFDTTHSMTNPVLPIKSAPAFRP